MLPYVRWEVGMRGVHLTLLICFLSIVSVSPGSAQDTRESSEAPTFCREGDGHPVHGRSWCVHKGYRLGATLVWRQAEWEEAILRSRQTAGSISQRTLETVVGAPVLEKLEDQRRRLGIARYLSGRWLLAEDGGTVLQVFAGRTPIAELADWESDGRVDMVLVNEGVRTHEPRFTR